MTNLQGRDTGGGGKAQGALSRKRRGNASHTAIRRENAGAKRAHDGRPGSAGVYSPEGTPILAMNAKEKGWRFA
jgi:hypothetical protein